MHIIDDIELTDEEYAEYMECLEIVEKTDKLQYVFKIKLNSLYGALTNLHFRFFDLRLGSSTTGTGRLILKHQCRKVAEIQDGRYDVEFPMYETVKDAVDSGYSPEEADKIALHGSVFRGEHQSKSVLYGDSVAGDSIIETDAGPVTIESLFTQVDYTNGDKEYCNRNDVTALSIDPKTGKYVQEPIKYVMRHLTTKQMYRVHVTNSMYVDVTEDHSLITGFPGNYTEVSAEALMANRSPLLIQTVGYYGQHDPRSQYPIELFELAGYVLGDGYVDATITGGTLLSIGKADMDEVCTKLLKPLQQLGYISSWCIKPNKHDVQISKASTRRLLRDWLYSSGSKQVPAWLFKSHPDEICAFLRGVFSADGWVNKNKTIGLTSCTEQHIRDVHRLLLQLGIGSTWMTENTPNSYKGKVSNTFSRRLTVRNRDLFAEQVGFIQDRKKITNQYRPIKSDEPISTRYSCIEKLPIKEQYVYDIEVGDTHMFFANEILVHNTDSVDGSTVVDIDGEFKTIEQHFDELSLEHQVVKAPNNVELLLTHGAVESPCIADKDWDYRPVNLIYRHKSHKRRFKITTSSGKEVIVTEDHSLVRLTQTNELEDVPPTQMNVGDRVITQKDCGHV